MEENTENKNIILLNDDLTIRIVLKNLLHQYFDKNVKIYSSAEALQGLGLIFILKSDIVIVDKSLPKHNGLNIVDYIKSNEKLKKVKTKVIVLGEGKEDSSIPNEYKYIDTTDENFPGTLVNYVKTVIPEYVSKINKVNSLISKLGKNVVKFSNKSDKIIANDKGRFFPMTPWLKWVYYQFLSSVNLTLFSFLVGKFPDENKEQQKFDIESNFRKNLPGIAIGLTMLFLTSITAFAIGGTVITSSLVLTQNVQSATARTWDGGGSQDSCGGNLGDENKWSCAENWNPDGVPGSSDTITFNGTSTKNSVIDASFAGTVNNITIASGYTGTITQARSLTASGTYSQAAGTFNSENQSLTVGFFTLSGGSFTAPSTNMTIYSMMTVTGSPSFNANNGTVNFTLGYLTISCGNITFNKVTITNAGYVVVESDCNLPLGNNPTLSWDYRQNFLLSGTLTGSGTLTATSATTSGKYFYLEPGSALVGFSGLNVGNFYVANTDADFSSYTTFSVSGYVGQSSGTFKMPTITGTNGIQDLTLSGGTFRAPPGNLNINHEINISASAAPGFDANGGTINFISASSRYLTCNNAVFNKVTINTNQFVVVYAGCNFPLGNNPTITWSGSQNFILDGTLSGTGTLTTVGGTTSGKQFFLDPGSSVTGFTNYSIGGYFTISSGVTFDSTALGGTLSVASGYTISMASGTVSLNGTANPTIGTLGISGGTFIGPPSNLTINGNLSISGGAFTAPTGSMNVYGNISISGSSTFDANGGTITLLGTNTQTMGCNNVTLNKVVINKGNIGADNSVTIGSDCSLPLGNDPTVIVNLNSFNSKKGDLILNGSLSGTGTLSTGNGSGGNITLGSTGSINGFSGFNSPYMGLIVSGTTLDMSGYTTFMMAGSSHLTNLSVQSGGTLKLPTPTGSVTVSTISTTGGSTFIGAGGSIYDNGSLSISGGTFVAPSGTLSLVGNISISGNPTFDANGGTITLGGSNNQTLACNNVTFNKVVINRDNVGSDNSVTIGSDCNLPLGNNPTVVVNLNSFNSKKGDLILNGSLSGTGTLTMGNGYGGTLTMNTGSSISNFSSIFSNKTAQLLQISGANEDLSTLSSMTWSGGITITSGSLTLPDTASIGALTVNGGTLNSTNGSLNESGTLTLSSGTLNAPTGNLNLAGAISFSSTGTFNAGSGTINLKGGTVTHSCNNKTFNLVTLNNTATQTVNSNCSFPLGNDPIITNGITLDSGTLSGSGTITMTTGILTLNTGYHLTGFSGFTGTSNGLRTSGASNTVDFSSYSTFDLNSSLTVDTGASLTFPNSGANFNITSLTLSGNGSILNAYNGNMNISGSLTFSDNSTFNAGSGSITFNGSTATHSCNNATFNLVIFNNSGTQTVSSNCSFPLGNNPTVANSLNVSGGTLTGSGTFNMTTGTLTLTNAAFSGFIGFNGGILIVSGASSTADFSSYTTFDTTGTVQAQSSATLTLPNNANIGGDLQASSTINAPSGNLYVGGSITGGSNFHHNNGTVILDGTNQTISTAALTFYNLTKIVPTGSSQTLTFPAGTSSTQTIAGDLILHGYDTSARLNLRTSSGTTYFQINAQGSRDLLYLDIKDSNNINTAAMQMGGSGSQDSGHNIAWNFSSATPNDPSNLGPASVISAVYTTTLKPTFSFTISDPNPLDTVKYNFQVDDNSDFSSPVIDYSTVLGSQGSKSFTVGQSAGTGTYNVGSSGQSLTTGGYYWRVNATDNNGLISNYTTANGGAIAFYIDSVAPATFTPTLNVTSPTQNRTPTVTFNTTDNVGVDHYQVKVDSGSFSTHTSPYTIPTLNAGDHTITVRAYDTTSNYTDGVVMITVEVNPPVAFSPTLNVSNPTNNTSPILTFSTTDGAGIDHYEVKINSGSFSTQSSPYQLPTLTQGSYTFTVRAYNINDVYTDGSVSTYIDTSAPNNFTPTLNVGNYTNNQTPTLSFVTADNHQLGHYEVDIDGGGFTAQTSPYVLPTLSEAAHSITVIAYDAAGNSKTGTVVNVTVDITAPASFTPTLDVTSPTSNTRPTVTFTTTDNNVVNHYEIKIDSGSFTTQSSPYQLDPLDYGDHTITVRAFDIAGNYTDGDIIDLFVDNNGPDAFIPTLNVVSPTTNTSPTVSFSTTDDTGIDHYEVKVDSGSFLEQESPYTVDELTEGSHTITVRAFDTLGNYTDGNVIIVIDLTKPNAFSPTLNTGSFTSNTRPTVSYGTTDNVGINHYAVKLDSGSFGTHSSPYQLPTLSEGSHSITVRAYDSAGNYRDGTTLAVTIDLTVPNNFTPTLNVTSPTINTTPTVSFSTTDNFGINYYRVQVDNGSFYTTTSPYQVPPLSNGDHTITVRVYDKASNYKDGSVNVTVNRTSPDPFTPTLNVTSPTNDSTPILSFSTTDAMTSIDHYEVKVDNGSFSIQTSPYQLPNLFQTNLNTPPHTITVRAYNTIDNFTDGTVSLYVDTTLPTINYSAPIKIKNSDITNTTFSISDNLGINKDNTSITGGVFTCNQGSVIGVGCSGTITNSGTVSITATDNAGSSRTVNVTGYIIDQVAPEITITAPTKNSATTITDTTLFVTDNIQITVDKVIAVSGGTIICTQTSQTRVDCTASVSDTGDLVINANDTAGNADALTESGYVVTATPPAPFQPSLNTTAYTNDTAPILFFSTTDADGIDHYEVKINNGSFTTQISPYQLPIQSAGFKTITVRAYDTQGNFRDGSIGVTIDTSSPAAFTPILNVSSPTNNTTPIVSFFTTDNNGIDHYEVQVDGGSFSTQVSPYQLPELVEGDHIITVRAFNIVGNYTDGSVDLTVDLTPPESFTPIITPGTITNITNPELTYSTTDNIAVSHYEVQVDSGMFSIQASPYTVPTVPEGDHTMTVVAYDTAGNSTTEMVGAIVDQSAPVISYSAPTRVKNSNITNTTITVIDDAAIDVSNVTASGVGIINCTQTSSTRVDCTSNIASSGTLTINAEDTVGYTSSEDIDGYVIETIAPEITIAAPTKSANNTITDTIIKVTDNYQINASGVNAAGGVLDCVQTNSKEVNCSVSIPVSGDLIITATDVAGNEATKTESDYQVTSGVPAAFTPTLNTGAYTHNTTPIVGFFTTDQDGINHYEVKIDDGSFSTQTSPYQLPELQEGFHTIVVRAFSNNGSFRDGSISVTIDLTNPTNLKIELNTENPTNNPRPIITFTADDENGIGHFEVKVASDGGTFVTADSPYQVPDNLEDGDHIVTVRAFDKADNAIEDSTSFTLDTTKPTGSIEINNGENKTSIQKVNLQLTADDVGVGIKSMIISEYSDFHSSNYEQYSSTKEWTLSNEKGVKTIYVKFRDKAGNESEVYSASIAYDPSGQFNFPGIPGEEQPQSVLINTTNAVDATLLTLAVGTIATNLFASPNIILYGIFIIRDRKKRRPWGIVYDQNTMEPIPFVTVRLYSAENNKLIAQKITDFEGKFGFIVNKGDYILEVLHSDYLSYKENFTYDESEGILQKDISLSKNSSKAGEYRRTLREKLYKANTVIVYLGLIFSVIVFLINRTTFTTIILLLYIVQFIIVYLLNRRKKQEWGFVYDIATGLRIKGAFVRIYTKEEIKQLDVQMTDINGRYFFNLKSGEYLISVNAEGYKFPADSVSQKHIFVSESGQNFMEVKIVKNKPINLEIPLETI